MTTRDLEAEKTQLRARIEQLEGELEAATWTLEDEEAAHQDTLRLAGFPRALSPPSASEQFRHKKRGSVVTVLGDAELQVAATQWIAEGTVLTIYRHVEDGKLWARPKVEFEDGRFERVAKGDAS